MRLPLALCLAALGIIDSVLAASSSTRNTHRPDALPPEPSSSDELSRRAKTAANITVPLPPSRAPSSPPSPVPTSMDLSISYALSDSCLLYLTTVLSSTTLQSCLPLSLLLTTSTSYASLLSASLAQGDLTKINQLVAYTASPSPGTDTCDKYFAGVLSALDAKGNCAGDLAQAKAVALDAQLGVGNYKLIREASTITNPDTGKYCYLEALASTAPDDLYLWSLPSGTPLPGTSKPTCSKCSSLLLNHYSESLDATTTLNGTILQNAINVVNAQCGASFAALSTTSKSGAARRDWVDWRLMLGIVLAGGWSLV
ncbi:hypothetical protein DB88DRAFT_546339 [Papiliotrema laurentii]|uniref:DUF7729 domain-containing protein n=1 Tax=Papiliotrema laurentii TaxID=5418 RepID=A0AAD9D1H5_PAPLA|nr:hypothetical protein DB88DRAFT_546339 [Papiliotrema laurentii]